MLCDAEKFLHELHKLFERKKRAGTVWVTVKRSNQKPRGGKAAAAATPADYGCLVRATDGRRKLSTFLRDGPELARFQASYALILHAHTDALKRRDKKKQQQQQGQQGQGQGQGKQQQGQGQGQSKQPPQQQQQQPQGKQKQKQPPPQKQQGGGGSGRAGAAGAAAGAAAGGPGGGGGRGGRK